MPKRFVLVVAVLGVLALVGALVFIMGRRSADAPPIPSRGGARQIQAAVRELPYYLQNDPQWGGTRIGGSNETMAAAGCTVTCTAMALRAVGYETDPQQLCEALKREDGFTPQGYLVWAAVAAVTQGKVRVGFPDLSHTAIEAELNQGRPVIAKILLAPTVPHWVLIVGKKDEDYLVIDPLNADKTLVPLSSRADSIQAVRSVRASES